MLAGAFTDSRLTPLPRLHLSHRQVHFPHMLALFKCIPVALVVRLGGGMEIVPIVEGVVLETAAQRNPELGGHLIDSALMGLLAKLNVRSSSTVESFLWRLVKERHAFVSLDPEQDQSKAEQDPKK